MFNRADSLFCFVLKLSVGSLVAILRPFFKTFQKIPSITGIWLFFWKFQFENFPIHFLHVLTRHYKMQCQECEAASAAWECESCETTLCVPCDTMIHGIRTFSVWRAASISFYLQLPCCSSKAFQLLPWLMNQIKYFVFHWKIVVNQWMTCRDILECPSRPCRRAPKPPRLLSVQEQERPTSSRKS